jgi:hypothetical protein
MNLRCELPGSAAIPLCNTTPGAVTWEESGFA